MKCWLCERDLAPGEGEKNVSGEIECIYCTDNIDFTVFCMTNPEIIPVVVGIKQLPKMDGVMIGLKYEAEE